jgi:hypothetical protein
MDTKVFVYIDHFKGQALPASWEAVGVARTLADSLGSGLSAILLGQGIEDLAKQAIEYGADSVMLGEDPVLEEYKPEPFATLTSSLVKEADVFVLPTTSRTREVAGMVAVDLETGVTPDVIAFEIDDGAVLATRPIYAGKLMVKVVNRQRRPQIISLRTRAFPKPEPDSSRSGEVVKVDVTLDEVATQVTGYSESEAGVRSRRSGGLIRALPWSATLPKRLARRWALAEQRSMPVISRTSTRWVRRVRWSHQTFTSPLAFQARSSIWLVCGRRKQSWPSTKTPRPRSSNWPASVLWAISSMSCRS